MASNIINTAINTINLEASSIANLSNYINAEFEIIINLISKNRGRVVITGIGKSAIVAQKIVATLNSTGTPSLFMHAADAIHGDLGMIKPDDIVIIISKSGESPEIKSLIPILKGFKNTIIGIVGNINSYLARESNFFINSTVSQEACPNNLAPTSSTTAQMVIGDAIAVCLMEQNNFTGFDFAKFHPGGNLGKRLFLKVKDVYSINQSPSVLPVATLKDIILEITSKRLGVTAVVNDSNNLLGIITDGDLRRMLEKIDNLASLTATDIYSINPKTISPNALAVDALEVFKLHDITQLLVVENNQYLGVLHIHDLLTEGIM